MWGLERLWLEGLLWGAGITLSLWERGRAYIIPLLLSVYGAGLLYEVGTASVLIETSWWAGRLGLIFSLLTAASWIAYPPSREGALALLIQLGAYTLLLRSAHLTMTWALLETAAIAGYFVALTLSRKENPWGTALTYFTWNVVGSALILMAIALRLAEGEGTLLSLSLGRLAIGWPTELGLGYQGGISPLAGVASAPVRGAPACLGRVVLRRPQRRPLK
jgi:formate hydrogenlyase subunit 3/multisubunit Na+/H+ antiporter MnhD subunit